MRFNMPVYLEKEITYIREALQSGHTSGDGKYSRLCHEWLESRLGVPRALLTTSGTAALEMSALLSDIREGDEVIMPSFTFVSTANAFVLRGARIRFVDIRPDTMNMDERLVGAAVTERTRAVVPVHYAGVACEMDEINRTAREHGLTVIEDAAQALLSSYKGRPCGTLGDLACFSFHETKNYSMGEGGAICLNDRSWCERAEIYREKGTDRSKFFRGEIDKYSWVSCGSSYLPSDVNAAYLYAQLEIADEILSDRKRSWGMYYDRLERLEAQGCIELAHYPAECEHNAHIFWIKVEGLGARQQLLGMLRAADIYASFHYVPLHSSAAGKKYGEFVGRDIYTTKESERLIRLPIFTGMKAEEIDRVCRVVYDFFSEEYREE